MKKNARQYPQGGAVRGPGTSTSDSILARVSNGEYVLPKRAVDLVGMRNLEAIRRAALAAAPRMRRGGPVSTLADKAAQAIVNHPGAVKNTVVGNVLDSALGIGTGAGGFVTGMTRSAPARATVNDVTQTQEYQRAQDAIRQGRGNQPTPGLLGLKGVLAGPSPVETAREMEQRQAIYDEQYRQMTGQPSPTEQRMLQEMNRASGKGYKDGGLIGQAQWEQLPRFMDGGLSLVPFDNEGYRQWQSAQQAAQQAREAAIPMQSRLPLRGGSPTTGIEPPSLTPQSQIPAIPRGGLSTTPPLSGVMPSIQPELPNFPSGPASKAPIPFEIKPTTQTKLGLEPKGLPLPKEVPYVSPKPTGLSLAPENVIDYRPPNIQAPQKLPVNVSAANTPAQLAALKQQAEAMATKLNITPQEAMQKITSMSLEPIETTGWNTPVSKNTGKITPLSNFGTGVAGGLGLGLASENLAPATGMLINIASNYFRTPLGLMDAAKLGYEQAKYDEMTSEGRAQYYPTGRPSYQQKSAQSEPKFTFRGSVPESSATDYVPLDSAESYFWNRLETAPAPVPNQTTTGIIKPSPNMMAGKQYSPPAAPSFAGQGDSLANRLPNVGGLSSYSPPQGQATPSIPTTPGPGSGGYENRGGFYRKVEPAPGFGPTNPNRVPGPGQTAGTTTYTIPGVSAMGGGAPGTATFQGLPKAGGSLGYVGTPETANMTQDEATAYNVANLNRQYEALKSRNEAYGMGSSNAQTQADSMDNAELMRLSNPFYAPGQGFGDEEMARGRFMRDLPQGKGRRAVQARNEAVKGLGDIQQGRMLGLLGLAQTQQRGQEAGMEAANQRAAAQQRANQWLMEYQQRQSGQDFSQQQALAKQPYELAKLGQEAKSAPITSNQLQADIQNQLLKANYAISKAQNPQDRANAEAAYQQLLGAFQQIFPQKSAQSTPDELMAEIQKKLISSK